ncbi:Thiol-disulfide oxidoreductase ResA [bioreactor metagenome]|uniref:Thiol-disulfide oxidoreductase ResA n=1 Tax=bioreactor metagenome TaxID=1076179 RepID=A0A645DCG7_9ZZZZ
MPSLCRRSLIASAALIALATGIAAHASVTVGQPAPDFALKDTSGKTVKLSDFKGKHVVLEWTNPGCPFVRKHYESGNMPDTQKAALAQGAIWLAVNSTEVASGDYQPPAKLAAWIADHKGTPTATLMDEDGTTGQAYGARTTPHMYIIDPQGTLIYAGGIDSIPSARKEDIAKATNYVKAALADIAAGKPVAAANTKPYGCSVKYKG